MTPAARGAWLVAAAAVCWGAQPTLTRLLSVHGLGPVELSALRAPLALAMLAAALVLADPRRLVVGRRDLPLLALFGVAGMAFVNWSYFLNLSYNSVATAILLAQTAPVIVAPLSALLYRERVTPNVRLACVLSVAGAFVMVGGGPVSTSLPGLGAGLLCASSYAVYTLLGKRVLARHDAFTVLAYALLFATAFWALVAPDAYVAAAALPGAAWLGLFGLATLATLIPFALCLRGMALVSPTRAALVLTIEPAAAIGVAWLALGEPLGPLEAAGGAAVIAAVLLAQRRA